MKRWRVYWDDERKVILRLEEKRSRARTGKPCVAFGKSNHKHSDSPQYNCTFVSAMDEIAAYLEAKRFGWGESK